MFPHLVGGALLKGASSRSFEILEPLVEEEEEEGASFEAATAAAVTAANSLKGLRSGMREERRPLILAPAKPPEELLEDATLTRRLSLSDPCCGGRDEGGGECV